MHNRTIANLRRRSSQRARVEAKATTIIDAMRNGQALHLHHDRARPMWWLSKGGRVDDEIAQAVIKKANVIGVGDALPLGADLPSQTWRYVE